MILPPGRAKLWTSPEPTGSSTAAKTMGMLRRRLLRGGRRTIGVGEQQRRSGVDQLPGGDRERGTVPLGEADAEKKILVFAVAELH